MGFYVDQVLPRAIHYLMAGEPFREERRACLQGVSGSVLEVGFGSGLNLPQYPPAVTKLYAVDPSLVGRKLARKHVARATFPVEFVGLEGERIPLEEGRVDAVVTTWTLCTVGDPAQTLAEMLRVLRPGGHYHFVEHGRSPDERIARWQDRLNPIQNVIGGGCNLNRPIDRLIASAGFRIVSLETKYVKGPKFAAFFYLGAARKEGR